MCRWDFNLFMKIGVIICIQGHTEGFENIMVYGPIFSSVNCTKLVTELSIKNFTHYSQHAQKRANNSISYEWYS